MMDAVLATARRIAGNAPISVRQAKKAIDKGAELDRAAVRLRARGLLPYRWHRRPQEGINAYTRSVSRFTKGGSLSHRGRAGSGGALRFSTLVARIFVDNLWILLLPARAVSWAA